MVGEDGGMTGTAAGGGPRPRPTGEAFYHVSRPERADAMLTGGLGPASTSPVAARPPGGPTGAVGDERRTRKLSEAVFERVRRELFPGRPPRSGSVFLWPTRAVAADHRGLYGAADALRTVRVDAAAVCNTAPVLVADFALVAVARAAAREAAAGDRRDTEALGRVARDYWAGATRADSVEAVRRRVESGTHEWPELLVPGSLPPGWVTPDEDGSTPDPATGGVAGTTGTTGTAGTATGIETAWTTGDRQDEDYNGNQE
jgi:hypothetical protein